MADRDRPKKSWRELDQARDRNAPRKPDGDRGFGTAASASSKVYRAALDALFEKGGFDRVNELLNPPQAPKAAPAPVVEAKPADPERAIVGGGTPDPVIEGGDSRAVLRKKLMDAQGKDAVARAFDKYCKACGMPKDFEALELGLDHTNEERIMETMRAIEALLTRDKPRRSRSLAGRLRFIEETHSDAEMCALAKSLRDRLG